MSGPYDRGLGHYDHTTTAAEPEPVFPPPSHLAIPGYEYDSVFGELGHTSSGCSSYLDSPNSTTTTTTYGAHTPTLINSIINRNNFEAAYYYNIESQTSYGIADSQGVQVQVQQYKWSNSIFESMNRATPYSPEEKKERIERYRSKRNLRNYNKKIKYECRKTLADSRPRVRGRFARNDERDKATEQSPFEEEDDYYTWVTILDALNKSDALISSF